MLNNTYDNAQIVKNLIKVLRHDGDYDDAELMSDEELIEGMVDTRDTIADFVDVAHSHNLEERTFEGIKYTYGFIKRSEYKGSTIELFLIEQDGWTIDYVVC